MAREDAAKTGVYERSPADLPPGDTGSSDAVATTIEEESAANDDWLMRQARDIYSQSTTYIQTNIEQGWARNLAHFGSRHAAGSKFASKGYKRARVFRPKTRASVKNHEATTARAMFSTANLINIAPQNPQDERQVASAVVTQAVLQHRLETRMPWYLTVVGAFQDTKVYGLCVGYQYWHYRARNLPSGAREVLQDQLCCDLVKPENFRFDPAADWRDPANTSSYIIMEKELRLNQVKAMMRKNGGPWRDHSDAELVSYSSSRGKDKQTERAREGNRTTPSEQITVSGLELISLRLYVINIIGEDWVFWTVGGDLMMTDPRPLQAEYPHLRKGERPFVIGYSTVEAHKNYPESDVGQAAPIQREINAIASQRVDNVDLVLQKRYFIKRGAQTDLHSLARNIPGGAVFTNDPEKDVQVIPTQDVTGSSYREQQVLDTEMDELLGGYSAAKNAGQSRPASQGVSNQASSGASAIQDYGVQTFRETWIQPVLQQMVRLIQMYETDDKLIALAANQARLSMRFGVDDPTDAILLDDLILRVDMGGGILDPMVRGREDRLRGGTGCETAGHGRANQGRADRAGDFRRAGVSGRDVVLHDRRRVRGACRGQPAAAKRPGTEAEGTGHTAGRQPPAPRAGAAEAGTGTPGERTRYGLVRAAGDSDSTDQVPDRTDEQQVFEGRVRGTRGNLPPTRYPGRPNDARHDGREPHGAAASGPATGCANKRMNYDAFISEWPDGMILTHRAEQQVHRGLAKQIGTVHEEGVHYYGLRKEGGRLVMDGPLELSNGRLKIRDGID